MTEKPTVAALVIGCGEGITNFLNPTEEEIKESIKDRTIFEKAKKLLFH